MREPGLDIINEVLSLTTLVKQAHIDLCVKLLEKHVTLDLPLPHTDKVIPFSKIAGIENLESLRKSGKYIPGCYRI
jgi:hypothetical protein